eukprot:5218713-Amphidinium_carterae.1
MASELDGKLQSRQLRLNSDHSTTRRWRKRCAGRDAKYGRHAQCEAVTPLACQAIALSLGTP